MTRITHAVPRRKYILITSSFPIEWSSVATYLAVLILGIVLVIYLISGFRNVPVLYPSPRGHLPVRGNIPLPVNMAGVDPLLAGQSFLLLPAVFAQFFICSQTPWVQYTANLVLNFFSGESSLFWMILFIVVVAFTFFYTDVMFAEHNYAEQLKRAGAQIPGINRGAATNLYLMRVLRRITLPGALILGFMVVSPWLVVELLGVQITLLAGENLFILTRTIRDSLLSIESKLLLLGYNDEGFFR
ncbi:MAG: SecY family transport protein [Chloroflexota bacterium]